MVNHFDMAREMARLIDEGKGPDEVAAEMRRLFPTATAEDCRRVMLGIDRVEMLEEERFAAARSLANQWFGDAPGAVIDAAIDALEKLKPSADTLFPKPDKNKG